MKRSIVLSEFDFKSIYRHLWRGDGEEHAAILGVGVSRTKDNLRLLVRKVVLVPDESFLPTSTGWHLNAKFISDACLAFEADGLGYVSVHNHPLSLERVSLSEPDFRSNRRSFPTTLDLVNSNPVASLVFGKQSAAGEVWEREIEPAPLDFVRVLGQRMIDLYPTPESMNTTTMTTRGRHQRQALMFGNVGQALLATLTVGVVGLGGGGSVLVQQLAHLGVGKIIGIDDDIVKEINLNRIVGSRPMDARKKRKKASVLARMVREIDRNIQFEPIDGDVTNKLVAERLLDCDFIFLATDNLSSRAVVNQLCYQFLIPGIQIGCKVETNAQTGNVENIHGNVRTMHPEIGCLSCHGAIPSAALAKELLSPEQRRAQDYVNEAEVEDPSVISLNSAVASAAVTDFQLMVTGLFPDVPELVDLNHRMWLPLTREWLQVEGKWTEDCRVCSRRLNSAFALGSRWELMPIKE